MKFVRWARLVLCGAPLLAGLSGCGNFWQAPSSSSSSSGGSGTTLTGSNFYILNAPTTGANTVSAYYINAGTLTQLSDSPYAVSGLAYSMAVDPTGSFAYISSTSGIYLYSINSSTGALTQGAQVSQDVAAKSIAIDPSGKWLLDASDQGSIYALPITSTGALNTPTFSVQTAALAGTTVQQMAFSPSGTLIAVALGSNGTQIFSFAAGNSAPLSAGSNPLKVVNSASGAAVAVDFDPQSRLLYVAETSVFPNSTSSPGGLRAFSVGASTLTELPTSPYPSGGTGPHAILAEATGNYVYVANWAGTSSGSISGFSLATSNSTFALTALSSTAATGVEPSSLAEDAKGNFVYAVSSGGSPEWSAYTFDATTASKLDLALTSTSTGSSPAAIVAAP